jgi:ribonucleoside-diphosphate reductase alpha chain
MTVVAPGKSFEEYSDEVMRHRYSHTVYGRKEIWEEICRRVCDNIIGDKRPESLPYISSDVRDAVLETMLKRKLIPGGRILSQTGRKYHQTDSCFLLRAENTREGWADLAGKSTLMFMSGGGVGVDYSDISPFGTELRSSGGIASGPVPLIRLVNAIAAAARQGGERRGACYGSLHWSHQDIDDFIEVKSREELRHTNLSVRFDSKSFDLTDGSVMSVFKKALHYACKYGDPGFQFDSDEQVLRNACTEVISSEDSDSCCLGSVNLARISSLQELRDVTYIGTMLLLANTEYTMCPTDRVRVVKDRNRRLSLGLMGVGEWFIQRGLPYGSMHRPNIHDSFATWLNVYKEASLLAAESWSYFFSLPKPVAVRGIAPTGTISIAGGRTTSGIEPLFHTAYIRTYNTLKTKEYSNGFQQEYVIEPVVKKLLLEGYDIEDIDTAYTLSQTPEGIERRLKFQAEVQEYVDNGIASTVNLPAYEKGVEERIEPILLKYLPRLRGVTFYPDGRHGNQPVKPISIREALERDVVMSEYEVCKGGVCGV